MQAITIKMEDRLLEELDQKLEYHRYSTRTEFIRDAIREKLSELEKEEVLKNLALLKGSSKRKTSDAELHAARDKAFEMLEKKFNIK
ncbi:ribbon-helix-helix protein, CopG family [Candidatus Woesearchaeota archaeon]|nr:ribbon-helix-helix protein, CopG family [Candidatus Woesearchaeota archaeon]